MSISTEIGLMDKVKIHGFDLKVMFRELADGGIFYDSAKITDGTGYRYAGKAFGFFKRKEMIEACQKLVGEFLEEKLQKQ